MDKENDKQLQRFIRLPEVIKRVGLGRTAIYDRIKANGFPRPVKLGHASAWVEVEIDAWMDARKEERVAA